MSWSEVFKINSNMKKPLNEQLRDMTLLPIRAITTSMTYTPEKTGIYKVICVGAGGDGGSSYASNDVGGGSGGGGGVAIKTLKLLSSGSYAVTVGSTASFVYDSSTIITATSGGSGSTSGGGSGGTASGGDYNYNGTSGDDTGTAGQAPPPGSVTAYITGLTRTPQPHIGTLGGKYVVAFNFGESILDYGGGGTGAAYYVSSSDRARYSTDGKLAAVIIVPLELEE